MKLLKVLKIEFFNKSLVYAFFVIFILSCSNKRIVGIYISKRPTIIEYMFLHLKNYEKRETGDTLKLNSDKTYNLTTCAIIESGNWYIINDSLILNCKKRYLKNKKLDTNKYLNILKCKKTQKYKILDDKLIRKYTYKGIKIVSILKK